MAVTYDDRRTKVSVKIEQCKIRSDVEIAAQVIIVEQFNTTARSFSASFSPSVVGRAPLVESHAVIYGIRVIMPSALSRIKGKGREGRRREGKGREGRGKEGRGRK